MKKKFKFNFKEEYKRSFSYIKESRKFIYFSILIFFLFVFVGAFFQAPPDLSKKILDFIRNLLEETNNFSWMHLIFFIFLNNLKTSFYGLFSGFLLGFFPFVLSIFNGYILGFVSSLSVKKSGIFILLDLLPHGIFELPAIFISFGLGMKFGEFIFKKDKLKYFKLFLYDSLRVFIFVIFPLLLIAAIIEGTLIFFLR